MRLGAYTTLPNPTGIELYAGRLMTANLTYGGFRAQNFARYYATANPNPGTSLPAFTTLTRIKLTWGNLSATEINALRAAFDAASIGYVRLQCPGLGLTYANTVDTAMVIVDSAADNLSIDMMQGYAANGEGPLVYDAQASFLVQTWYEVSP